jgi:hypothetical protein
MSTMTPASVLDKKSDILFPSAMRWPLTYWGWAFSTEYR